MKPAQEERRQASRERPRPAGEPGGVHAGLRRKGVQAALVAVGGAALALVLWAAGTFSSFEGRTWDWRVRLLAAPGRATPRVALILLDQASLDWGSEVNGLSWPWPREVYSYVVNFCARGGARAVAFDVLYTEPSKYGVYDDQAFASAVAEYGRFVAAVFPGPETGSRTAWPEGVPPPQLRVQGLKEWLRRSRPEGMEFSRAAFPIPELAGAARALGNVNLASDPDGVYRRGRLFNLFDGRPVPSLALGAYLAGAGGQAELAIRPGSLSVDGRRVPVDREGRAVLRYRGPRGTHDTYSAAAVIQSEIQILSGEQPTLDPEVLRDRYVFFGFSAPGLYDLRPSPVSGVYPGVEINATMLDDLLSADFLTPAPAWAVILLAAALALGAGFAVSAASGAGGNALAYALFLPLPVGLGVAAYPLGFWLPMVVLELATVSTLVGTGLLNYATEGRQKRYIKNAFRQYLSPTVIEELIAHPERLKLGGERRELSIFFSDLQGFTGISEGLPPEELTSLLNDYLSAMTDIIQQEGGTIDKYEGDAIIAFWNAPVEQPDHAARAVRAALRCQERLAELRPGFKDRTGKELFMRIGVNSGPAVVGNMGSRTRFDYTMLGDAVNLASRLEGINKQFGTYTMISQATLTLAGQAFPARELGRVVVVGRREPVTVHEPMNPDQMEARRAELEAFAAALSSYYSGRLAEAEAGFQSIASRDPPAARYAARCRELSGGRPERWDGVWVMTSK